MNINIFEFSNSRDYIKAMYDHRKQFDHSFSYREFSKLAGFKSHSVLKLVMDGKMNISKRSIPVFANAFKLTQKESDFFYHLVLMNQAKNSKTRIEHAEKMMKHPEFKKLHPLSVEQLNYYKHWYYIPIREMVAFPKFKEDYTWISKNLNPHITIANAKKAVEDLLKLGLLIRDEKGLLKQAHFNVSTGNEVFSKTVALYHKEMLKKATEAIDRFPLPERDISSVTLGIPTHQFGKIKEKVQLFRKELLKMVAEESGQDQVIQINIQLFPLTKKGDV